MNTAPATYEQHRARLAGLLRRQRIRRRCARELEATGARVLTFEHADGRSAVVHRNSHRPPALPWRVTWLLTDGTPAGHSEQPSAYEAIYQALLEGYEPKEVRA